ncbi:putative bifunctional diguanylate cyclase/phosphodiesterase [Sphingomonas sp. Marseille-Q8236]
MRWFTRRLRSIEFCFAAMLTAVFSIFMALSVVSWMFNRQLLSMIDTSRRITVTLEGYAAKEASLHQLRGSILTIAARGEWPGSVSTMQRDRVRRAILGQIGKSMVVDETLPERVRTPEKQVRLAERRFVRAAMDLIRQAQKQPTNVAAAIRGFERASQMLQARRDILRQALRAELDARAIQVEALTRRALVQMALAAGYMLILVGGLFLWLRWRIMQPLMAMVAAVRAMSVGHALPRLCSTRRADELGELARGLQALSRAAEERERIQRQVEYLAHHDSLTGLANRVVFGERLASALQAGKRIALLAIDLDGFKGVNDTLGHARGDAMLQRASAVLIAAVREDDVVARIGGDEFAIVHHLRPDEEDASALVDRIFAIIAADRDSPAIRLSIGIALSQRHGVESDELHACADIALYRAKADGRHRASHYDAAMDEERRQRNWLAHELRDAGARGDITLAFQPIADCATRAIIGQEALARWTHPVLGPIRPDIFIPIAEESGLIVEIGQRLFLNALHALRQWPSHWMMAVNLSPVQLRDPHLATRMLSTITGQGIDPRRIEVEVTEGVLIDHRETATANLSQLRAAGLRIVMDDFGTGHSSLSSLQQFPFDKIKIDRSFTSAMGQHGPALSIVRASIGLGRSLNIPIVAEGVETEAQHRMLCKMGCDQIQGYLIGRPMTDHQEAA